LREGRGWDPRKWAWDVPRQPVFKALAELAVLMLAADPVDRPSCRELLQSEHFKALQSSGDSGEEVALGPVPELLSGTSITRRQLFRGDFDAAVTLCAESIADLPQYQFAGQSHEKNIKVQRKYALPLQFAVLEKHGDLWGCFAGDRLLGVASLMNPNGKKKVSTKALLRFLIASGAKRKVIAGTRAYARTVKQAGEFYRQEMAENKDIPRFYLNLVAVQSDVRRHGVARFLLEPTFAQADSGGFPVTAIVCSPENKEFLQRVGFDVCERVPVDRWKVAHDPTWVLVRTPRQRTKSG
jgi:GNAT superfamily N-acetyltransferase